MGEAAEQFFEGMTPEEIAEYHRIMAMSPEEENAEFFGGDTPQGWLAKKKKIGEVLSS